MCSIALRKRKEEIEDKIEAEEFQDSEDTKKEVRGIEGEDKNKEERSLENKNVKSESELMCEE